MTKNKDAILETWDYSYYGNIYKIQNFNIDEEKLKEFFPAENVKLETMAIYQELLSLTFVKVENAHVWHPEVSCYEVKDKVT